MSIRTNPSTLLAVSNSTSMLSYGDLVADVQAEHGQFDRDVWVQTAGSHLPQGLGIRLDRGTSLSRSHDVFAQPIKRRRQPVRANLLAASQRIFEPISGDEASNQGTGPSAGADESFDLISLGRGQDSVA